MHVIKEAIVTRGRQQEGFLSPLLRSLVLDELLITMKRDRIYTQVYIDNFAILLRRKYERVRDLTYLVHPKDR